ncbi:MULTISPECIES: YgaP family membrane protein [Aeromonas]|uniref:YgaP family membrane protein n=1 Tax=Aeromonas TaxID=642 RepID=UPI00085827BB|nr:DUF2892 domain-containing protein [Aeromonas sp. ASNIH2]AUY08693.1 DUF2892 domain-containing protein [Aeromonas sp. ASNIH2]OCW47032.1 rhodanese [Aeromonas caviae]
MTIDNGVRVVAGGMLLLSLLLTTWVHPGFVWLSVFVGVNLIQSAFTGVCPAAAVLRRMGLK